MFYSKFDWNWSYLYNVVMIILILKFILSIIVDLETKYFIKRKTTNKKIKTIIVKTN